MSQERIVELKRRISEAQEAYYNLDPIISDQEYDALVDELRKLEPSAPEVIAVGAPIPTGSAWEKVKHEIPMGSLSKANTTAEFEEWATKTGAREFFITHKIDGSSMELVYENGKLQRCVTRGDGIIGEDVMANISLVPNIPHQLPYAGKVTIRGEIVMFKSVFQEKYAEEYANPRNTAAAKVRERKKAGIDCKNLHFIAYWMSEHSDRPKTIFDTLGVLEKAGFKIPVHYSPKDLEGIKNTFQAETHDRDRVPYEIDGMVVSVNDLTIMEELGDLNMRPRGQIAWKFDAAMGETRMVDVKWQVGPSGRITPVAVVEPVEIGGVTITNISLHNMSIFNDLRLWPRCRVLVSRRNDVIPYIEKNLDLEAA